MRYAILSVYNKDGITDFARELVKLDWKLMASGGTAKHLQAAGLEVQDVADLVGEPILGHRVVTLSREIHAALLSKDTPEDNAELERIGVPRIDLVYIDLYPLEEAIRAGKSREEVIEMTDIGGPTLLRSAAKGQRIVMCGGRVRTLHILEWLRKGEPNRSGIIQHLQATAEATVAQYCLTSAMYHFRGAGN